MPNRVILLATVAAWLFTAPALGQTLTTPAAVKNCAPEKLFAASNHIRAALPSTTITSVDCSPIPDLYEVVAGRNVFYTDQTGRFLLVGSLYDTHTQADLTAPVRERVQPASAGTTVKTTEATMVDWQTLPTPAVRWGNPLGIKVAVFGDPNCGFCRALRGALKDIGADVHEFAFPILRGSREKWEAVWCAKDRHKALELAYGGQPPKTEPCDITGLDLNDAFARSKGWRGTPILIREDGVVQSGFRSPEALLTWLQEAKP
jgi:thiol:disulfide interchange protein DsbC